MKKRLVVLSAAALTIAAAVPALALENEFHGMYRLRGMMTNFQDSGLAGIQAKGAAPKAGDLLSTENRSYTLFEQRARIQYIAKANDDLKLVTHFEIDSTWGDAAYDNGRGKGAGLAGDTVNLETKNVYLDFNIPSAPVNVKLGLQGWTDAYKGIFLSDDVAGAVATGKSGAVTATAAFFRTYDSGTTTGGGAPSATSNPAYGKQNVDVYVLDGKFAVSKELTVGASYYLANNDVNYSGQQLHNLGANVAAKLGTVDLDAFLLYQIGDELYAKTGKDLSAFAGQVAAKANLGTVTVRGSVLYASGDDGKTADKSDAYQNIFASGASGGVAGSSVSSGVYYPSNMLLLFRSVWAMDSDTSLVSSINNGNRGLVAGFLGADAKINDKLTASVNLGTASVDKRDGSVGGSAKDRTTSKDIGTEINAALNYALYPNLTTTVHAAYVMLGGYTKAGNATDLQSPWLTGVMMNYTF